MRLTFSPIDEASARAILAWQYDEPYSFYNPHPAEVDNDLKVFTDPNNSYYSVMADDGFLIAYFCFGREARVPGGDYSLNALDIGCGVRPELTGRKFGSTFIRAGLHFGQREFAAHTFRVTVAAFNTRALRVCERAGFLVAQRFWREQDRREFVVLTHEA